MARPNPYARTSNFTNWQSSNPGVIYNGTDLDTEFNAIAVALNATIANVALIQRADGALNSQSVGRDQLAASVVQGINTPAAWVTAKTYSVRDSVLINSAWYWCLVAHTSGVFATDLAAGDWQLINDFSQALTSVFTAVSTTNNVAIGTGAKTLTIPAGKGFLAGQWVTAIDSGNAANSITGTVTSYTGTSLVLSIPAASTSGSGTPAGWNVVIAGAQGQTGSSGGGTGNMINTGGSTTGHIPKYTDNSGTAIADGYAVGTGANNLVQRDGSGNYPAGDGSALTNISGTVPIGASIEWNGVALPSASYLWEDGAAISRVTYATLLGILTATATVTISNASPAVITRNAHGRAVGDKVSFETTGGLPAGMAVGTNYFVSATGLTTNTYQISTAQGGSSVNTSSAGTGTQTERFNPHGCGDGSTTFNKPDKRGRFSVARDDMGGSAAGRLTVAGSGIYGTALGSFGGAETVTLTTPQLPAHNHTINDPQHAHEVGISDGNSGGGAPSGNNVGSQSTGSASTGITINNTGGGGAHQNTPNAYVTNKAIRAL